MLNVADKFTQLGYMGIDERDVAVEAYHPHNPLAPTIKCGFENG